jgi:hypothetical protein
MLGNRLGRLAEALVGVSDSDGGLVGSLIGSPLIVTRLGVALGSKDGLAEGCRLRSLLGTRLGAVLGSK